MNIPGLGKVSKDDELDWHYSDPIPITVLGGKACRLVIDGYDEDRRKDEFHAAIANFLSIDAAALKDAEQHVFRYYEDCNSEWEPDDDEFVVIESPGEVWRHVRFGSEPMIARRGRGDKGIYVVLECGCDWEVEHGLQIVFKDGLTVNKVGPYDGHVTNSDAYSDDRLENVVYLRR